MKALAFAAAVTLASTACQMAYRVPKDRFAPMRVGALVDELARLEAQDAPDVGEVDRVWWLLNPDSNGQLAGGPTLRTGLCDANRRAAALLTKVVPEAEAAIQIEYLGRQRQGLQACPSSATRPSDRAITEWMRTLLPPKSNWARAPRQADPYFVWGGEWTTDDKDQRVYTLPEQIGTETIDNGYVVDYGWDRTTIKRNIVDVSIMKDRPDRLLVLDAPIPLQAEELMVVPSGTAKVSNGWTHYGAEGGAGTAMRGTVMAYDLTANSTRWAWVAWADRTSYGSMVP